MKPILFIILLLFFVGLPLIYAEEIQLKSGQVYTGKIIQQDENVIVVDIGIGMNMTFYRDEIERIDVKPLEDKGEMAEKEGGEVAEGQVPENDAEDEKVREQVVQTIQGLLAPVKEGLRLKVKDLFQMGLKSLDEKDYKTAKYYFQQVLLLNPEYGAAYAKLAAAEFYLGNYLEAVINYGKAESFEFIDISELDALLNPMFEDLESKLEELYQLGIKSLNDKNYTMAKDYFNQVLSIDPEGSETYLGMAVADFFLQNYSEAIENYEKARELEFGEIKEFEGLLKPYQLKKFTVRDLVHHIDIEINGNTRCTDQIARDLLAELANYAKVEKYGMFREAEARFLSWEKRGESWRESWKIGPHGLRGEFIISFALNPDGKTTFTIAPQE